MEAKHRRAVTVPSNVSRLMEEEWDSIAVRLSVCTLKKMHTDVAILKTRVRKEGKKGQVEKCFQPVGMRPHQSASSAGKEGGASVRAELRKGHEKPS